MMKNNRTAFALSIVLWIVAALMFGITTLLIFSKQNNQHAQAISDKLESQIMVEEVLELIKYYVMTADNEFITLKNDLPMTSRYTLPVQLKLDDTPYKLANNCTIQMLDTTGLLNVMYSSPAQFAAEASATKSLTKKRQIALTMTDSLLDWIDPDIFVRLNGAESNSYKIKYRVPYTTRDHRIVQDIEEIRLVHGFDKLSDKEWKVLTTKSYFGLANPPNLLLMTSEQLRLSFSLSSLRAKELIRLRKKNTQEYLMSINALDTYDEDNYSYSTSKQIRIIITVVKGKAVSKLSTVISFIPTQEHAMTIMNMQVY